MKKLLLVVATLASSAAFAAGSFVGATYQPSATNAASRQVASDTVEVTGGTNLGKWTFDGQVAGINTRGTTKDTVEVEGRAKYDFGPAWVRGGLGKSLTSGNDFTYATYAVGSQYAVMPAVAVFGSAELTDPLKSGAKSFMTYQVGGAYSITKYDSISLAFDRKLGGQNTSGAVVGYRKAF